MRVHRLGSLHAESVYFFALTPSPSPTQWERGVGAHGSAPSPLSRLAGEGDTGGEGKKLRLTARMRWAKSPLPQKTLC
jgi:hypothetical protein